MEDLVGRNIHSYKILELIGEGGQGVVYRALDTGLDRFVAIKAIRPAYRNRPDFVRRFDEEAKAIARLEHPNIVPIYDYWREPNGVYIVMRLLSGKTLWDRLKNSDQEKMLLDLKDVSKITYEIASALDYVHSCGFVHGCVQSSNILFDDFGNSFLADFDLARLQTESSTEGLVIGEQMFMAPETIRDRIVDAASDIYTLACTVFEMLTGRHPFSHASSPSEILYSILKDEPPKISEYRPKAPETLDMVFQRALAKEPANRYQSASAFSEALNNALRYMGTKQRVFISYSSKDRIQVDKLNSRLQDFGHSTWYDQRLKNQGGINWWQDILQQIRDADLFVFALSPNSLSSYPCQLEYTYAQRLQKRILPVMLERIEFNTLPSSIATLQVIDFTLADGPLNLRVSIDNLPPQKALPSPLPEAPPVPIGALNDFAEKLVNLPSTEDEQQLLIQELKRFLTDNETRSGATILLNGLQGNQKLTLNSRQEIAKLKRAWSES